MDPAQGRLSGDWEPPHTDWSTARRNGCGCLIALLVLVVVAMAGFAHSISGWGVEAPPPARATATGSLSASATLDASHPLAVQTFTVSIASTARTELRANAKVDAGGHDVRLTILDDEGMTFTYRSTTNAAVDILQAGHYVAIVELAGPPPAGSVEVGLAIDVTADFLGQGTSPVPSDARLRVDPTGPFATRTVSVLSAEYREAIPLTPSESSRTLRLTLTGDALPVSAGGKGLAIMTFTPESHTPPGPHEAYRIDGRMGGPLAYFGWGFAGSARAPISPPWTASTDPSEECHPSGLSCVGDYNIVIDPRATWCESLESGCHGASFPPAELPTITMLVQVRVYLLDAATPPNGAAVTLQAVGSPTLAPTPTYQN